MSTPNRRNSNDRHSGPAAPTVVLHIDRLVLKGVSAADRDAVVEALKTSLAESFAPGASVSAGAANPGAVDATGVLGGLRESSHRASLRVPAFDVAGAAPKALGGAAGAKLAGGLKR